MTLDLELYKVAGLRPATYGQSLHPLFLCTLNCEEVSSLREFAELMLVAIVAWGSYALIVALEEGLSEWLTKRVLQKGQLADSEDDEVEGCGGRVVEDLGEEPKELNRYVHLRSRYRRNRRQARHR